MIATVVLCGECGARVSQSLELFPLATIEAATGISKATLKRDARIGRLPGAVRQGYLYVAPMPAPDSEYVANWKLHPRSRVRAQRVDRLASIEQRVKELEDALSGAEVAR